MNAVLFLMGFCSFFAKQAEAALLYLTHCLLLPVRPRINHIQHLAPARKTTNILVINEDIDVYLAGCAVSPLLLRIVAVYGIKLDTVLTDSNQQPPSVPFPRGMSRG